MTIIKSVMSRHRRPPPWRAQASARPKRARVLRLEVTDCDAAARVVAQAQETFGRIDVVVVNNAGYSELVDDDPAAQRAVPADDRSVRQAGADNSGHEATDPRRVAQVVRDLAARDDAPVRLLLGSDAVPVAWQEALELAASDEAWREVSLSVSDCRCAEEPRHAVCASLAAL